MFTEAEELVTIVNNISDTFEKEIIELRQDIHADPERAFNEYHTAQKIKDKLEAMGLNPRCGIAKTGIVVDIEGAEPGKTLLLRADMDALPIQEENDLPYCSQNPGVMHACGHDVHTANLLGTAKILYALRNDWKGTVRLVFQPAEESGGGGRKMIREGIMDDKVIDASMALHVAPLKSPKLFTVGWKNVTSYSDRFDITVYGKKAHTASPQNGVDAISIAAQIINAVNGILLKNIDPMEHATYSIGKIQGGTAPNIIADQVEMVGMMRNATNETRQQMKAKIESISTGVAAAMGGRAEFTFHEGYSSVYNDPELTDFTAAFIEKYGAKWAEGIAETSADEKYLIREKKPLLGAEDYGFYTQKVPSCYYRVAGGFEEPAHSSGFKVNDQYIKLCTRSMACLAIGYLMDLK